MMGKIMADWKESEIYRIDHYLGEEMVRNITHLRFGNEHLIEPLLNNKRVSAVKVELLEEFGCEGRGGYFDEFGMIRDVHQNRESYGRSQLRIDLLQVLLAIAAEKPKSFQEDHWRDEKVSTGRTLLMNSSKY
jgi:glucose-6-phosphate 1-dehydrogenase